MVNAGLNEKKNYNETIFPGKAERPPPPQAQPLLAMAAEERVEYI